MKKIKLVTLITSMITYAANGWSTNIADISDETPVFITIGQSNADGTAIFNQDEDARLNAWYASDANPGLMKMWYRSCFINTSLNSYCWCMDGTGDQIDAESGWMNLWYRNENTEGRTAMNMHSKYGTWSKGDNLAYGQNRRGMEGQFGMRYQLAYPDKELYIMKLGCGGSAIATWTSDDNHNWNYFYQKIFRPAMNDLLNKGKKPRLAGVWWMQGCKDRNNTEEYYLIRLKELIAKIRSDLGFPDAKIYIGHIVKPGESTINPTASKQFGQSVRDAQDAVTTPENEHYIENTEIIDGRDCPFDDDILHWSHVGINLIGDKIANRVIAEGPENWASFETPGYWSGLNTTSPTFIPAIGNPEITYEINDNQVTATLKYDGWSETKTATLSEFYDNVVYVKSGATGSGASWDDACGSLSDAISIATENGFNDIYVANGLYRQQRPLNIAPGITLTGGFAGNGTSTIVTNEGNGAVIVLESGTADACARIVNLTVTGAKSGRGVTANAYGQIIRCVIENNIITGTSNQNVDDGAGVWTSDNVIVENSIIRGNQTAFVGGGMSITGNNVTIKNCLITGNKSTGAYKTVQCSAGGIIFWAKSLNHKVINSTITNNDGAHVGGIWIAGTNSGCHWINSVIWGNSVNGNSVKDITAKPTANNNNHMFVNTFSSTELNGITMLSTENRAQTGIGPCFVAPENGDYTLSEGSPLIDAGDDTYYGESLTTDLCLAGNARKHGSAIDVGAYEHIGSSGVNAVTSTTEDYNAEYYNLNGIKINANQLYPGIYIERKGEVYRKIIVR